MARAAGPDRTRPSEPTEPRPGRMDRAAAVRAAMRTLVARDGFHGASMGAVAREAGVATGTAYVHYPSKDALILAAYLELKADLGAVVAARLDPAASGREQFEQVCRGFLDYLSQDRAQAQFLVQVDASPFARQAHEQAMAVPGDPLVAFASSPALTPLLVELPPEVLFDLGIGPLIRLVATGSMLDEPTVSRLVEACWRAVTRQRLE